MNPRLPDGPLTGTRSLPPLGGRLLTAYQICWWFLLALAIAAAAYPFFELASHGFLAGLRIAKAVILLAVAVILFRRRRRDAVAALLGISFLLWTISSSTDFAASTIPPWLILLDRLRFLPFALALLFFPKGEWQPRTLAIAASIILVFAIGAGEALGILTTRLYLPLAIGCVLLALATLLGRYRSQPLATQQQLKWVALGLVAGVGLILTARAGSALTAQSPSMAGKIVLEAIFQLGVVVIALGFLTSLVRYRLYDAEAAISKSAAYAGLTLALVATFAASEAVLQTLGQRYFGMGIGDLSGGIAAGVAAILLTPLHNRISGWADQYFQSDLIALKNELPQLLLALSGGTSVSKLGTAILPKIEQAVHSTRIALIVDGRAAAARGISRNCARDWFSKRTEAPEIELFDRRDGELFPLGMALRCPYGNVRGWLLLGPRPDQSFYGQDELGALRAISIPFQQSLYAMAARQVAEIRARDRLGSINRALRLMDRRLERLEAKA